MEAVGEGRLMGRRGCWGGEAVGEGRLMGKGGCWGGVTVGEQRLLERLPSHGPDMKYLL